MAPSVSDMESSTRKGNRVYHVYPKRWLMCAVIVLLNISNAGIWISYSPVSTFAAAHYHKSIAEVNYFSMAFMIVGFPFAFVSCAFIDKFDLAPAIHVGSVLNVVGMLIKTLGSEDFVKDKTVQFAVSLVGQVIAATAQTFLLFIPTKASQTWFPENHRTISTTLMAMSNPVGIVIGTMLPPFIVIGPGDIPLNNYVWLGLAVAVQIFTLFVVTSSRPPTPPSKSSEMSQALRIPYLHQLAAICKNVPYLLLLLLIGYGICVFSTMSTVTQQMLCGLGYSTVFSGFVPGVMVLTGLMGSAVLGLYVDKTKNYTTTIKATYVVSTLATIVMLEFYLLPGQEVAIMVLAAIFGFFGLGGYPIGLELAIEATYPVEEAISMGFIFAVSQLFCVVMLFLFPALATPMLPSAIGTCNVPGNPIPPMEYSNSVILIMVTMTFALLSMVVFFHTPYRRQDMENSVDNDHGDPDFHTPYRRQDMENSVDNDHGDPDYHQAYL